MSFLRRLRAEVKRFFSHPKEQIHLIQRESWKLSVTAWRSQDQLVAESVVLSKNLTYRAQLDVIRNSHPCHDTLPSGAQATDRIVHSAIVEGYERCLKNLESLAEPVKKKKILEATFEPVEKDKK